MTTDDRFLRSSSLRLGWPGNEAAVAAAAAVADAFIGLGLGSWCVHNVITEDIEVLKTGVFCLASKAAAQRQCWSSFVPPSLCLRKKVRCRLINHGVSLSCSLSY